MRRFLCSRENIEGSLITFDKEQANHITKVLRMNEGDRLIATLGDGTDMECVLASVGKICQAEIQREYKNENETKHELALFQSVIKNDKMDFVIQKATELGIKRIVPVITRRTVVKTEDEKRESNKVERWQRIALEACKQCERGCVPKIENIMSFEEAIKEFEAYPQRIVAYEEENTKSITAAVRQNTDTAYFIGPEGGICENEMEMLKAVGAESVSLGKRILRAETASVACGAVILALMGEMDV